MPENLHPRLRERPLRHAPATLSVRALVATWQGRTLRIQNTAELRRTLAALEAHEADLYQHSPHAPRLLQSLRLELAKPERQAA